MTDNTATANRSAETVEQMAATMQTYHGVHVEAIGEDGNLVALGHHDDRRVIAAMNAYSRSELGCNLQDDPKPDYDEVCGYLHQKWAVLHPEQGDYAWYLETANVTEATPGAFAVTVWDVN